MVNWVPGFLSPQVLAHDAAKAAETARLKTFNRGSTAAVEAGVKAWEAANPAPTVTVTNVADHIDHVAKVAGHDHVGIGADLDGIDTTPVGLGGVETYPTLFAELIRRGWSDANLAKLAGGNVLRVLRKAEATSRAMTDVSPFNKALEAAAPAP
jgi:membrane dipeptidase